MITLILFLIIGYGCFVAVNPRVIGNDYMIRFFLIPRNRWLNIYLHKYVGSDDDRALHDHPWASISFLLKGSISEIKRTLISSQSFGESGKLTEYEDQEKKIRFLIPFYRDPEYTHRIILNSQTAWTLFITGGKVREWGFYCPKGWVHWKEFTDSSGNKIGRGCE